MTAADPSAVDVTATWESGSVQHDRQLARAQYSPCGKYLVAAGHDGGVQRWQWSDQPGEEPNHTALEGHSGWVTALEFAPAGGRLFTADSWGRLCCWPCEQDAPRPLWTVETAHDGWIRDLAVSPDGSQVATCGNDNFVRVWTADGKPVAELAGHTRHVYRVAFHPAGNALASGDLLGSVKHWDLAKGQCVRNLDASPLHHRPEKNVIDGGGVRGLAFSPDGKLLAASGITDYGPSIVKGIPGVVMLDWETGEPLRLLRPQQAQLEYKVHGLFVTQVRFHPQGFLMGAGGEGERDGALWFWQPDEEVAVFEINRIAGGRDLSLHPGGHRIAVAQFEPNGRGKNGGNGRKTEPGEYHSHNGLVRFYDLTAKPAAK